MNPHNVYFYSNTFTVSPSNYVNNGTGYYGIAVDGVFLDANFDNFTNNIFTNAGLEVLATNYPISGSAYPNTDSNNLIQTTIAGSNTFR